eukprot:758472-Hanusia_phi.AAC.2
MCRLTLFAPALLLAMFEAALVLPCRQDPMPISFLRQANMYPSIRKSLWARGMGTGDAKVDEKDESYYRIDSLCMAAIYDDLDAIEELVKDGVDINGCTHMIKKTPLLCAAEAGKVMAVLKLVSLGAQVNLADDEGFTALHFACFMGREEAVKTLLELEADPNANASGNHRPIHYAAMSGSIAIVRMLYEAGADVHAKTVVGKRMLAGYSARAWARLNEHDEVAQYLESLGVEDAMLGTLTSDDDYEYPCIERASDEEMELLFMEHGLDCPKTDFAPGYQDFLRLNASAAKKNLELKVTFQLPEGAEGSLESWYGINSTYVEKLERGEWGEVDLKPRCVFEAFGMIPKRKPDLRPGLAPSNGRSMTIRLSEFYDEEEEWKWLVCYPQERRFNKFISNISSLILFNESVSTGHYVERASLIQQRFNTLLLDMILKSSEEEQDQDSWGEDRARKKIRPS